MEKFKTIEVREGYFGEVSAAISVLKTQLPGGLSPLVQAQLAALVEESQGYLKDEDKECESSSS
jgi:hypothetical protein